MPFLIQEKLNEIKSSVINNQISVVSCPHSTGKTICIPNYMTSIYSCVYCVVSNSTIAKSMYLYEIANSESTKSCQNKYKKTGKSQYNKFGYAYNDTIAYTNSTRLIYCTYNYLIHLFKKMIGQIKSNTNYKIDWPCDLIIFDEYQLRYKEMDTCFAFWLYIYKLLSYGSKLLILNSESVINKSFYDNISNTCNLNISLLKYNLTHPKISIIYDEYTDKFNANSIERYTRCVNHVMSTYTMIGGNYLIFLPTYREIVRVKSILIDRLRSTFNYIELDGSVTDGYKPRGRTIWLASKIPETCISLHNITIVIDSLTNHMQNITWDGGSKFEIGFISRDISLARSMYASSRYIVLASSKSYELMCHSFPTELNRLCMYKDIINLMNMNINPNDFYKCFVDNDKICTTIDRLTLVGCIDMGKMQPTPMANFISAFPVGLRRSTMIYYLYKWADTNIYLHLLVISTIEFYSKNIMYLPKFKDRHNFQSYLVSNNSNIKNFCTKYEGYTDIDTIYKIWLDILSCVDIFNTKLLNKYCKRNMLNISVIMESQKLFIKCLNIYETITNSHLTSKTDGIDTMQLNSTFYRLANIAYSDCELTLTGIRGRYVVTCQNINCTINQHSIHELNLSKYLNQTESDSKLYAIMRTTHLPDITGKTIQPTIKLIHALSPNDTSSLISIFSSDMDIPSMDEYYDECEPDNEIDLFLNEIPD